jgi:ArsR family transcriptional regulator, arsenate/arsenite/antimonite-responsive transcriptional repressor
MMVAVTVPITIEHVPTGPDLDARLVRVLADPVRAAVVQALAVEQLCTCHLVAMTGAKQTNVSNHLRVLREAGVVDAEQVGRYTYYRLRPEILERLAAQFGELAERAHTASAVRRPCD